jgi:type IV pilus assembly protein PilW
MSRTRLHGLSLIELLVSLAVGLLIVLAAVSSYVGAAQAGRMAEAQMRMNEDAQAALAILTQHLRMAGNNPDQPNRYLDTRRNPVYAPSTLASTFTPTGFAIRGCASTFSNIKTAKRLDDLVCAPGGPGSRTPHSIAVTYEADAFNTVPTASKDPTDCLGYGLTPETATLAVATAAGPAVSQVPYFVADNRFYIGTSTTVVSPSLYCKGKGGAQPLVENIEDMQFTYGLTPTAPSAAGAFGYVQAVPPNAGASHPGTANNQAIVRPAVADEAAEWARVASVQICIVVRSEKPVVSEAASAAYRKCDGTLEKHPPDLRLRRAYSATVALRNRVGMVSAEKPW